MTSTEHAGSIIAAVTRLHADPQLKRVQVQRGIWVYRRDIEHENPDDPDVTVYRLVVSGQTIGRYRVGPDSDPTSVGVFKGLVDSATRWVDSRSRTLGRWQQFTA
jgi:hypothetical protein